MFHQCLEFVLGERVLVVGEDTVNLVSNSSFCLDLELEFELVLTKIKSLQSEELFCFLLTASSLNKSQNGSSLKLSQELSQVSLCHQPWRRSTSSQVLSEISE